MARPSRSLRNVVLTAGGGLLTVQAFLFVGAILFRIDLDVPERSRPGRTIQHLAVPEWRSALDSRGASLLLIIADGARLRAVDSGPNGNSEGGRPSHFRYEAQAGRVVLSCQPPLVCQSAIVVPIDARLAFVAARSRLPSLTRDLVQVVALAGCGVALIVLVTRSSTPAEIIAGAGMAGVALAIGASRVGRTSAWLPIIEALAYSSPLLIRPLRRVPRYVCADLLLWRPPGSQRSRGWRITKAGVLVLVVVGFLLQVGAMTPPPWGTQTPDGHRNKSLEIAVNRTLCGSISRMSTDIRLDTYLTNHPDLLDRPLPDWARLAAGSVDDYCGTVTQPLVNNENSLMYTMYGFLRLHPEMSVYQLGWLLQLVRLLALLLFACALVEAGASLLFAVTVLAAALCILANCSDRYYSVYPFPPVLLAVVAAAFLASANGRLSELTVRHSLVLGFVGLLVAFAANMRTSHLPVYLAMVAVSLTAAFSRVRGARRRWSRREQALWAAAAVGSFTFGYVLFALLLIRPLRADLAGVGEANDTNISYHIVAHPLVLGLGLPPSLLSIKEGIEWADPAGVHLARSIDPRVQNLSRGYEEALFRYYIQLWTRYPHEMREIYVVKFWHAGRNMLSVLSEYSSNFVGGAQLRTVIRPLSWVSNGITLFVLYLTAALLGWLALLRTGSPLSLLTCLFGTSAALLQIETAAIIPFFHMSHHGAQLLAHIVLCVIAWQIGIELCHRGLRWLAGRLQRRSQRATK